MRKENVLKFNSVLAIANNSKKKKSLRECVHNSPQKKKIVPKAISACRKHAVADYECTAGVPVAAELQNSSGRRCCSQSLGNIRFSTAW